MKNMRSVLTGTSGFLVNVDLINIGNRLEIFI